VQQAGLDLLGSDISYPTGVIYVLVRTETSALDMPEYIRLNLLKSQLEQKLYIHAFSTMDGLPYSRIMESVLSFVMVSVPLLVQYYRPDVFFAKSCNRSHSLLLLEQCTHEKLRTQGSITEPSSYPITS